MWTPYAGLDVTFEHRKGNFIDVDDSEIFLIYSWGVGHYLDYLVHSGLVAMVHFCCVAGCSSNSFRECPYHSSACQQRQEVTTRVCIKHFVDANK